LPGRPPVYRFHTRRSSDLEMLDKAVERVQTLAMPNVTLKVMDATSMDFADDEFDKAVATYTISAVPDPVAVLREMRRVDRVRRQERKSTRLNSSHGSITYA